MKPDPAKSLPDLWSDLREATDELHRAESAESVARNNATAARNRVNEAQKLVDASIEAMKENAPSSTDWGRAGGRRPRA